MVARVYASTAVYTVYSVYTDYSIVLGCRAESYSSYVPSWFSIKKGTSPSQWNRAGGPLPAGGDIIHHQAGARPLRCRDSGPRPRDSGSPVLVPEGRGLSSRIFHGCLG